MAEDVVILLSSDDSDAFVTPHPCASQPDTDCDINGGFQARPAAKVTTRTSSVTARQRNAIKSPSSMRATTPTATSPAQTRNGSKEQPVRSGFVGFSSDDMSSSPFPAPATKTQRRGPHNQLLAQVAARAGQMSGAFTGSLSDSDDDFDQQRPSKRQRVASSSGCIIAKKVGSSVVIDGSRSRQGGLVLPSPTRQAQALTASGLDDRTALGPQPMVRKNKLGTELIDLVSSSESEATRAASTKEAEAALDSDFADIDDLLMESSPPPRVRPTPHVAVHRRDPSNDDIMVLADSPFLRAAVRPAAPDATSASRPTIGGPLKPQRRQPIQRSFSEGRALVFDGDDDDEIDGDAMGGGHPSLKDVDVEALLASWKKRLDSESVTQAPNRRRSSFDSAARKPTTNKEADREMQRREREAAREEKRREKEAERERRQKEKKTENERKRMASEMAKEKKARERAEAAAFNDANRSRVDKVVAAPEMVVRLPTSLPQATREVAETMLAEIKSSHEAWESPVGNVVAWGRKVTAEYKPDLGYWVPVPERIVNEKHAMAVLRGEDFVQLVLAGQDPDVKRQTGGYDLASHVHAMKSEFTDHSIIYLIEGLNAWKSKNRTIRNRQFVAAVRNAGSSGSAPPAAAAAAAAAGTAALARFDRHQQQNSAGQQAQPTPSARPSQRLGRRGLQQPPQYLDETVVDDALLELQIENAGTILVHETQTSLDTARWIKIFTEQIATAPYRQQKEELYAAAASFCMDTGQIATGDGGAEVYALMLQQIGRVTEPVALGIAARFENVPKLIRGFEEEGPLALEACLKSRNRNGSLSDRVVGQALSRRIYKVFMGQDPATTNV